MKDLELIKASVEDSIISMPNVSGIGVGYKWVNGLPTDTPALLVFVEQKHSHDNVVGKYSAKQVIPSTIDGLPTDVIEVGHITKQIGYRERVRPLQPGYSCGQAGITAGTIGGFFIDKDGDPIILSNNHVLANENRASIGDPIFQPGPMENTAAKSFVGWPEPVANLPYFASLKRYIPISANGNLQDSAIATINDKIVKAGLVNNLYPTINKRLNGFADAKVNMQVQKCGRTTGYTTGRVMALNASFSIAYDMGSMKFNNCVVCSPMSQGGDSGSIITDMNMNAIALLFAGSPKVTIANPIRPVINEYGLKLWASNDIVPSMELDDGKWSIATANGTVTPGKDSITVISPANAYAFFHRPLAKFTSVKVVVNSGTDGGATWGSGISIIWPTGSMKVNLRSGGSYGGYINGNELIGVGQVHPNTEYILRIRKSSTSYIGEISIKGTWTTVVEAPLSVFAGAPTTLTIGKSDKYGWISNHTELGVTGTSIFRDLDVK